MPHSYCSKTNICLSSRLFLLQVQRWCFGVNVGFRVFFGLFRKSSAPLKDNFPPHFCQFQPLRKSSAATVHGLFTRKTLSRGRFYVLPHGGSRSEWCNLGNCGNDDAVAETLRGLRGKASLRSPAAKGREGLAKALRLLATHSLPFGIPSLARYVYRRR